MTSSHTVVLARGQRWREKTGPKWVLRILAAAEGYAMVRYPRCEVWVIDGKTLREKYELVTDEPKKVQTRECPVCRTGHDLPLCPERK
jgi:hypothetical protein